jgi:Ca-activated chloride channel homolog
MTFSEIVVIVWVAVTVAVLALYALPKVAKQRRLRKRYGAEAVSSHGVFKLGTLIPVILLLGAGACLALAFGQFRLSKQATEGTVILALDVSDSMDATDVQPDRLTAAEAAAQVFIGQLPAGFKIGVVTFAGKPVVLVDPTGDRDAVSGALEGLATSRGTVIGDGLSTALDTIAAEGQGASAVVLLSDGQDTGSKVTPTEAAARARGLGVPVFTVAITGSGVTGSKGPSAGPSAMPEGTSLLGDLAGTTGAQAFSASSADQLTGIYRTLGSRLSYDLAVGGSGKLYLILAAALLLAAGLAASVLSRRE